MSVYVDEPIWPYRGMIMCHMLADTVEELHAMADHLGMRRQWFQNEKYPHYDLCRTKRGTAVKLGAIEIDRRKFVQLVDACRHDGRKSFISTYENKPTSQIPQPPIAH